jgi:hypothetical protein
MALPVVHYIVTVKIYTLISLPNKIKINIKEINILKTFQIYQLINLYSNGNISKANLRRLICSTVLQVAL